MARRRIIEGTWTCGECDTQKIKGRHKECPSCGSPREKHEAKFDFGGTTATGASTEPTVTDAKGLELARAGRDWVCSYCGASNRGDFDSCVECAAARGDAVEVDLATPPPAPKKKRKRDDDDDDDINWETPAAAGFFGLTGCSIFMVLGLLFGIPLVMIVCLAPISTDATVTENTWVRQSTVERLVPQDQEGWKNRMDTTMASPPPSKELAAGMGQTYSCETKQCWPRPPAGGGLAKVTGRSWSRTISTKRMSASSGSGWDEQVPRGRGAYPSGGSGGAEGLDGSANCHSKQRVAEKCRSVSKKVACGTDERCTVNDLGNGFAEEVCTDHTRYCTESEQVCDPAEYDQWCTWTMLRWTSGRRVDATGRLNQPHWPSLRAQSDESVSKSSSYSVHVTPLAGDVQQTVKVSSADALMRHQVGAQYFFTGGSSTPVPRRLLRKTGVDCGDGITRDSLSSRDRCRYQTWSWHDDAPLYTRGDGSTAWPVVDLKDDGREKRAEWVDLKLEWARGSKERSQDFSVETDEGGRWPVGRAVRVSVSADGSIREWEEDKPVTR